MWPQRPQVSRDAVARHLVLRGQASRDEDPDIQEDVLSPGEDSRAEAILRATDGHHGGEVRIEASRDVLADRGSQQRERQVGIEDRRPRAENLATRGS